VADLTCGRCRQLLDEELFSSSSKRSTGRQLWCKACVNASSRKRYSRRKKSLSPPSKKRCQDCGNLLRSSAFTPFALSDDGLRPFCRDCAAVRARQTKYFLSRDEVLNILLVPACQSCGLPFAAESDMNFDHNPQSGFFRGVLCRHCNTSAGAGCKQQISRLRGLVAYLERHDEQG